MAVAKRDRTRNQLLIAAQTLALEGGSGALSVNNLSEPTASGPKVYHTTLDLCDPDPSVLSAVRIDRARTVPLSTMRKEWFGGL